MKKRTPNNGQLLILQASADDMIARDQEIIDKIKRLGAVELKEVLAKLEQSQQIGLLIQKRKHQDKAC
jgi:hypothetical protein